MEDKLIQITAAGNYYESTINKFAQFRGYSELINLPSGSIPNPQTPLEFVQEYIKNLIASNLAEMEIVQKRQEINEQHLNMEESVTVNILNTINMNNTIINNN